jgi:hypothetical protein
VTFILFRLREARGSWVCRAIAAARTRIGTREVDVVRHGKRLARGAAPLTAIVLAAIGMLISDSAAANDCAAQCYAQENACRRRTQGSQSCDAELTRCLQGCRARR